MKKRSVLFAAVSLLPIMFSSGCASSERMTRMSGGVFREYSMPKRQRLLSRRFLERTHWHSRFVGTVENTPVNAWPFFFGSENYHAILWPVIDWDAFGMAVRPFYNQEGDEYSVLFPLSAWNPVSGSGWVLNTAWTRNGFGFLPLSWQHSDGSEFWCFYTPFFIYSRASYDTYSRIFLELLMGYYFRKSEKQYSVYENSFFHYNQHTRNMLAYKLRNTSQKIPSNQAELDAVREKYFVLPDKKSRRFGFVPLFDYAEIPSEQKQDLRMLGYLAGWHTSRREESADFLGPVLARYEKKTMPSPWQQPYANVRYGFTSWLSLTYFQTREKYRTDRTTKALRKLKNYAFAGDAAKDQKQLNSLLKEIDPAFSLPVNAQGEPLVLDKPTLKLFLADMAETHPLRLETEKTYSGGFLPLLHYDVSENSSNWFSLAALTYYRSNSRNSRFWSVPLLSYAEKGPNGSLNWLLTPLVWYSRYRLQDRVHQPIFAEAPWITHSNTVTSGNDFALCGLYYHNLKKFYVSKAGFDSKTAEYIRSCLIDFSGQQQWFDREQQDIQRQSRQIDCQEPADKIAECRQTIRVAKLRLRQLELDKKQEKLLQKQQELQKKAAEFGLPLDRKVFSDPELNRQTLNTLFDRFTEERSREIYGSWFFFRRENFHNGDCRWHILYWLAQGEKKGEIENSHVLYFLYRYRQDGSRKETIFFPFVSIREDETGSRFSFLGRVYQKTVKNGRTSGYFLFIPF